MKRETDTFVEPDQAQNAGATILFIIQLLSH